MSGAPTPNPDNGLAGDRILREQTFHDSAYESQVRANLSFMYPEQTSIKSEYENAILRDCQGTKALEYGCGLGSSAYTLAEHGASVTAVDISDVAIHLAREEASRRHVTVDFQLMNAERLTFSDNEFDLICGTSILHHLDLKKALTEIHRVLTKEGRAIFIEPLGHNPLINAFRWITPRLRSRDEHPLRMKDLQSIRELFPACRMNYFYLLSIATLPLARFQSVRFLHTLAIRVDGWMFRKVPPLRRFAWQVLIIATK